MKLNNDTTSSVGARTPTAALQLDQGNEKGVAPLPEPSTSAPQVYRDKAKEVTPGSPSSPSSNEDPLSGSIRSSINDRLSELFGNGGMGGHTLRTPSSPPSAGPAGRPLGSPIQ